VAAFGDESLEALFRFGNGIRRRDADMVEAVFARGFLKRAFDRGGIAQKSRSA
jgi:hypothetical protein